MLFIIIVIPLYLLNSNAFIRQERRIFGSVLAGTDYRLWDDERRFPLPGFMGRQTQWVLNTVADLLRIQGEGSEFYPEISKNLLIEAIQQTGRNGLEATAQQRKEIEGLVEVLEAGNPTLNPARATKKMEELANAIYRSYTRSALQR